MKGLLLCVHVVVKTLNLEISRCHLGDDVEELQHMQHDYFSSFNQSDHCFWRRRCRCLRPCLSSLWVCRQLLENRSILHITSIGALTTV